MASSPRTDSSSITSSLAFVAASFDIVLALRPKPFQRWWVEQLRLSHNLLCILLEAAIAVSPYVGFAIS